MPLKIKMTAKRQATFPTAVCEALSAYAGDTLVLDEAQVKGRRVWVIEVPRARPAFPWMGSLRKYAERQASHDMRDIRAEVGRQRGDRT